MAKPSLPSRLAVLITLSVTTAAQAAAHAREVPWSFHKPAATEPPAIRDAAWPRDDLDRFVLAKLDAASLKPNPDADRATLIRRASFDLLGLPPSVADVDAFVRDSANDDKAFAKVVD